LLFFKQRLSMMVYCFVALRSITINEEWGTHWKLGTLAVLLAVRLMALKLLVASYWSALIRTDREWFVQILSSVALPLLVWAIVQHVESRENIDSLITKVFGMRDNERERERERERE